MTGALAVEGHCARCGGDACVVRMNKEFLSRIALVHAALPVHLGVSCCVLTVTLTCPHRETGESVTINHSFPIPYMHAPTVDPSLSRAFDSFTTFVWRCLTSVYMHELSEALHVDGVRVKDPHAELVGP